MQAERIRRQRITGDRRVAAQGCRIQITDCLVTEMLRCLPTENVFEVAYWIDKRLTGDCRALEAWKIIHLVFLKKPDAKLEKGLRGFRAIALLSVLDMVYNGSGWIYNTRRRNELARGSRERRQLRAYAGPGDEYTAERLGMAGRPPGRLAARILRIQYGHKGKLGREDGTRCG